MNKTQLIDVIAEKADLSKTQAKAALESTLAAITLFPRTRCLASDKYTLRITYEQDSTD